MFENETDDVWYVIDIDPEETDGENNYSNMPRKEVGILGGIIDAVLWKGITTSHSKMRKPLICREQGMLYRFYIQCHTKLININVNLCVFNVCVLLAGSGQI